MTKDGLKKEASMLDLSADNQDGFDDTDGQLYTSNSLLFLFAKITRPLMRKNSNIYFIGGFCYERENQKVYG